MSDLFGGPQLSEITTQQKIAEIESEIKMRKIVYKKRVESGKMKRETALRKLLIMESILRDYKNG